MFGCAFMNDGAINPQTTEQSQGNSPSTCDALMDVKVLARQKL
jgi:hypothetical protein